jgi:hypothetical protein
LRGLTAEVEVWKEWKNGLDGKFGAALDVEVRRQLLEMVETTRRGRGRRAKVRKVAGRLDGELVLRETVERCRRWSVGVRRRWLWGW